jgi:hypothetical protein
MTERPSATIYLRNDPQQAWKDCDSAYELGYIAAEADIAANLSAFTTAQHSALWSHLSDYAEGYRDAYADHRSIAANNLTAAK